jgi:hypothetical protein
VSDISINVTGTFDKTGSFLDRLLHLDITRQLTQYAEEGVRALSNATPVRSGLTAASWAYEVNRWGNTWRITWLNRNVHDGVAIAILLEYGHGTGTGGYVAGHDYINPAIQPVMDAIANNVWKAVTSS